MVKGKSLSVCWLLIAVVAIGIFAPSARADEPQLRLIKTDHYLIHTDLDDDFANELARLMEGMFGEYSRRLAEFGNREVKNLDVYLLTRKSDYLKVTEDRFRNTGGIFIAGRKNLLAAYLQDQGKDTVRRTLQHEAFHQFAYNMISDDIPIWMNEGIAQVFEDGIWVGDRFVLGQVAPRRLRQLQADIDGKRIQDFQPFMAITPEQWSKNLFADVKVGASQYSQAWAMVHFLVNGEDGKFRPRLINMLTQLHEGKSGDAAYFAAFSSNYAGFRSHFDAWAAGLQASPESIMLERQSVLADMVVALNDHGKRFTDVQNFHRMVTAGRMQLEYTKGDVQWKTDARVDNYFSNAEGQPLGPQMLYFVKKDDAPLADIVCQCSDAVRIRTRFYQLGDKWWHESKIEAAK